MQLIAAQNTAVLLGMILRIIAILAWPSVNSESDVRPSVHFLILSRQ